MPTLKPRNNSHIVSFTIAVIAVFTNGCGTPKPAIVKVSPDTYLLRTEDRRGIFGAGGAGKMKMNTIREANAFAENQGKIAVPISINEHPMGVMGDWASVEYQFKVVDKADPEAQRTALVPRPDIVIDKSVNLKGDIRTKDESTLKPDLYSELMKLDDLRKKGLITDAEYDSEKQKLLNRSK